MVLEHDFIWNCTRTKKRTKERTSVNFLSTNSWGWVIDSWSMIIPNEQPAMSTHVNSCWTFFLFGSCLFLLIISFELPMNDQKCATLKCHFAIEIRHSTKIYGHNTQRDSFLRKLRLRIAVKHFPSSIYCDRQVRRIRQARQVMRHT